MKCCRLEKCIFFNGFMAGMTDQSEILKQKYCLKKYNSCARAIIAEMFGAEMVPKDLFPDDMMRAANIIETRFEQS